MSKAVLVLLTATLFGCSSHTYHSEAVIYTMEVENILIEEDFCTNKHECDNRNIIKFEAAGWRLGPLSGGGIHLHIYELQDDAVMRRIITAVKARHHELSEVPLTLLAYSPAHGEKKHLLTTEVFD